MMKEFANKATQSKAGLAALGLATLLSFSNVASADNHCQPLMEGNTGTLSAGASAFDASKTMPFPLAIEAQPGEKYGVGNVPIGLVGLFENADVNTQCFIDKYASKSGLPEFSFYIMGEPHEFQGKTRWTLNELKGNDALLSDIARAAKAQQLVGSIAGLNAAPSN